MRLFIAEKPSLAQAIAGGLGNGKKCNGYFDCGSSYVTWCFGHILEQFSPEDYNPDLKKWRVDDLPIIPDRWKLKVSQGKEQQYNVIKNLVARADEIVNAGDPDREGQLLIDEVLNQLGVLNKKPVRRILLNALDDKSVKTALGDLRDNRDFVGLRNSALARSRADWLIGMNLSRIYTIRARSAGYPGTVSVGRVQTPTLSLVVRREMEIKNFKPMDYYLLKVTWQHHNGELATLWKPSPDLEGLDSENRLIKKEVAEDVARKIEGQAGKVTSVEQKKGQTGQRLPYSLSALQIDAGKRFGYSPQEVLDTQQSLYEKKLTTYPRSDCDYLPENQLAEVPQILGNLKNISPEFARYVSDADTTIKSKAWNDKKISAHHAIIPTTVPANLDDMNEKEKNLYLLVAKAYLAQFYPAQSFLSTQVTVECQEEIFTASGKVILDNGWKKLYRDFEKLDADEDDDKEAESKLPAVQQGENVQHSRSQVTTQTTKPPKRFNPSTLLKAMKEIGKYVKDKNLKPILKDCSGIGTEATRASIIEGLQKRGFIREEKKFLVPTETAYMMLKVLSETITYPDITARWEKSLDAISRREMSLQDFFDEQKQFVMALLDAAKEIKIPPPHNAVKCPKCGSPMIGRTSKKDGKTKYFWGCSSYPECKETAQDRNGKPIFKDSISKAEKDAAIELAKRINKNYRPVFK